MSPDNYLLAHYLFKDEERCTEKRLHRGTPNFSSSVNFVFPEKERVRKALSKLLLIELKQCALITLNA